jgi:glycosyltransferase involved in cell wall biosynthesis
MGLQSSNSTLVLAAVALPPPLHGQSVINSAVIDHLAHQKSAEIVVVDVGPRTYRSALSYHLNRVAGALRAIALEFRYARCPKRTFYTVVESGWGRCYNLALVAVARLLRFQIVLHHHTSAHTLNRSAGFELLVRIAGRDATHVVLGQEMARDLHAKYPSAGRSLVVHNAPFLPLPQNVSRVGSNLPKLTIGFLSNLTNEKGLDSVFDVLRAGRAAGLELDLKIAGPAANAKVTEQIKSAQLEFGPALKVLGPVGPSEKSGFFTSIDLFLFPSRYKFEAQPLVVLEAMSFGVPVVASRRGYTSEIVGEVGHMIDDQSTMVPDSIAICRKYVEGNLSLAAQGSRSRERFVMLRNEGKSGLKLLQEWVLEGGRAA